MKVTIFSARNFEIPYLEKANGDKHDLKLLPAYLNEDTAALAQDSECVAMFSSDLANKNVLEQLKASGVKFIALRSAGYNHINLIEAERLGFKVANVPSYSPYAIAEHTVALMLALNRKLIRANSRIKELNFSLDGLTGFDMHGKTVGIAGLGHIGKVLVKIMHGFGCRL